MTKAEVRKRLLAMIEMYGTRAEFARAFRINKAAVTEVLQGNRGPNPKMLKALGLRKLVTYEEVGK